MQVSLTIESPPYNVDHMDRLLWERRPKTVRWLHDAVPIKIPQQFIKIILHYCHLSFHIMFSLGSWVKGLKFLPQVLKKIMKWNSHGYLTKFVGGLIKGKLLQTLSYLANNDDMVWGQFHRLKLSQLSICFRFKPQTDLSLFVKLAPGLSEFISMQSLGLSISKLLNIKLLKWVTLIYLYLLVTSLYL